MTRRYRKSVYVLTEEERRFLPGWLVQMVDRDSVAEMKQTRLLAGQRETRAVLTRAIDANRLRHTGREQQ